MAKWTYFSSLNCYKLSQSVKSLKNYFFVHRMHDRFENWNHLSKTRSLNVCCTIFFIENGRKEIKLFDSDVKKIVQCSYTLWQFMASSTNKDIFTWPLAAWCKTILEWNGRRILKTESSSFKTSPSLPPYDFFFCKIKTGETFSELMGVTVNGQLVFQVANTEKYYFSFLTLKTPKKRILQ